MKKTIVYVFMMGVLFGTACSQGQNEERRGRGNFDPKEMIERQADRIAEALELTDDQKAQLLDLNTQLFEKQSKVREENRGDREAMRSSMQEINQEREESLKKIFSEEQWNHWLEIRDEFSQRRRGGGGPGGRQ